MRFDILATDGGGFVPTEEVEQALGHFLLFILRPHEDRVWGFIHKGHVWRASFVLGLLPGMSSPVPVRLHFDYIREQKDS